jgi:hypothetical protein
MMPRPLPHRVRLSLALVLSLVLPRSAPAKETPRDQTAAARAFAKGSELFQRRDYLGAIEAFEEAYGLRAHFLVQCNIARCHEWSGDLVQAAEHYRRCLDEGGANSAMGPRAKQALRQVESRMTWVQVDSPGGGGTIHVDGRSMGNAPGRVPMNPGTHLVEVRRPSATPASLTIKTRGGEQRSVTLIPRDLTAPREQSAAGRSSGRPLRPRWFWGGVVLTAALAAAATGCGIWTLQGRDDYEVHPTEGGYEQAVNRRLLTNVLWGATAAAAGASGILFFYTDFSRGETSAGRAAAAVHLGVGGRF